jgi:hypothetical protein
VPDDLELRLRNLLRCIFATNEEEIAPETWDLQVERVAEMSANGENIGLVLPAIQHYLENSPDCRAEFEALVCMMRGCQDSDTPQ